ncbi:MAG: outer membrane beta-barrel family protein, partial [Bacteroidota bacterium]
LRSIPASSIEEIEIIINPSAKFVADGTAGILNVILKKGKEKRLNANVELFAGHRLNLGTNVNINKGGKKGSWFVNSGIGYSEPKGINDIDLDDLQSELLQTRQMSERFRDQLYYLVNAGGTLNLGERSSISGEANFRRVDLSNNIATQYQDFQSQTVFDTQQRLEEQSGNNNYYQGALTFNQKFKKEGHQMVIRLSTERTEEDESSTIETTDLSQGGLVLYNDRSSNDQSQSRSILSVDYTLPFAGNAKIELGYQGNIFDLDNDFTVERNTDNVWLLIPEFTDQTTFSQDVHAFYAQYAKKLNRFNLRLGLRTEITDIDFAAGQAADINKDFTDLFPFASVSYQLSDKTTLSYTINRRINRPPANALIPFNSFSDERNVFVGNPDLDPSYTFGNQLGLNTRLSAKLRLNAALYYRETTDELEFFVDRGSITINGEANDVYLSQLANIGTYYSFGLQSGIISNLAPWLNMYTGLIFNGFEQVGTLPNANFDGEGLLFYGRHNINITVRKAYKIQILNNYRGPIETGQYRRDGIYTMGLGISKDVFGGRGALVFNVSDVFNSGILNITTFGNDFLRELRLQNRVRQINVSLTYNFNQNAYKGKKGNQFDEVEVVR